ncbi:SAF domain-containing protein [Streptomonospora sp. S1-112]|uniref:SAF domain-containing protein n=1 Tax=Streptomonospora mangrovi TaxID=2883123 RepID=A0A9X3NMG0_9ACTN|nr:SAF domain-containing protein [Streptomonospora mangrovi]MDA0566147.1 SAF domain-containing protein [Streptomonospora mangrovi]
MTGTRGSAAEARPAAAPPTVRLLGTGPRRWRWLGLGVAIMTAGALAGVVAVEQLDDRQGVLVAGSDLAAGQVLTAADLEVARISVADGVSALTEDQLEEAVGSTLAVPVPEGGVLPETALGADARYPAAGQAVVGAVLAPGRFPASLQRGAAVSIVLVEAAQGAPAGGGAQPGAAQGGGAAASGDSGVTAYPARVQSFELSTADGSANVELLVDAQVAGQVAAAAANEQATVVQVSPSGGS